MRTRTCAAHCRSCGGHFTCVVAFDAHRWGSFNLPLTSPDRRRCLASENDSRFERVEGRCQLRSGRLPELPYGGSRRRAEATYLNPRAVPWRLTVHRWSLPPGSFPEPT